MGCPSGAANEAAGRLQPPPPICSTAVGLLRPARISSADFLSGSTVEDDEEDDAAAALWLGLAGFCFRLASVRALRMFLTASAASSSLLISLIGEPTLQLSNDAINLHDKYKKHTFLHFLVKSERKESLYSRKERVSEGRGWL